MVTPEAASLTTEESRTVGFPQDGKTWLCFRLSASLPPLRMETPERETDWKCVFNLFPFQAWKPGTSGGQLPTGRSPPTGGQSWGKAPRHMQGAHNSISDSVHSPPPPGPAPAKGGTDTGQMASSHRTNNTRRDRRLILIQL